MANTATAGTRAAQALAQFNAQNNPNGLFLRYARGRVRRVWGRLTAAMLGAATFGLLKDPQIGLLVATLLMAGEAVDCVVLRRICDRWSFTNPAPASARRWAFMASIFQALTVAVSAVLVWTLGGGGHAQFFATAFLAGVAMDAGTSLRFYRPAALARLVIFGLAFAGLDIHEMTHHSLREAITGRHGLDMVASLMLAFVVFMVIRYISRTHDRRMEDARTILQEQQRLLEAQQALEAKEFEARRLALVARHANDSVVIYNKDGTIQWVNETFLRMTGFEPRNLIGHRMEDVIPAQNHDEGYADELIKARNTFKECRAEIKVKTAAGATVWLDINLTPILDEDGMPLMMIAVERDITEAKARQTELARARRQAEAAAKAKSRFLATMSHELRTPMNGVIGTAELLADTKLTTEQQVFTDTIIESGQALLTIINDILDLSRMQSGATVLARKPFDIGRCVERAAGLLRPTAQAKDITLTFQSGEADRPNVVGDEGRLRQIVLNLIGNAIKFTKRGGVTVDLRLKDENGRSHVEIAVTDTGIGIPADRIDAIFDSFTQAEDNIARRFGGTGLGLTISRRLAREMGGDIHVSSTQGAGSTFTLAVSLDHEEAPATVDRSAVTLQYDGRGQSVLLVEDNRTNAFIVEKMLAPTGVDLRIARNGVEALDLFREEMPDIVFMDLQMPDMDGFETIRALREGGDDGAVGCPVIALTANAFAETRAACRKAGFDGFVSKPIDKATLLAELIRHLPESGNAEQPVRSVAL